MYNVTASQPFIVATHNSPPSSKDSQPATNIRVISKRNSILEDLRRENFSPIDIKNIGTYLVQASGEEYTHQTTIANKIKNYFTNKLNITETELLNTYGNSRVTTILNSTIDTVRMAREFSLQEVKQMAILVGMKQWGINNTLSSIYLTDDASKIHAIFGELKVNQFFTMTLQQVLDAVS